MGLSYITVMGRGRWVGAGCTNCWPTSGAAAQWGLRKENRPHIVMDRWVWGGVLRLLASLEAVQVRICDTRLLCVRVGWCARVGWLDAEGSRHQQAAGTRGWW